MWPAFPAGGHPAGFRTASPQHRTGPFLKIPLPLASALLLGSSGADAASLSPLIQCRWRQFLLHRVTDCENQVNTCVSSISLRAWHRSIVITASREEVSSNPFLSQIRQLRHGEGVTGARVWMPAAWPGSCCMDSLTQSSRQPDGLHTVAVPISQTGKLRNKEIMPE